MLLRRAACSRMAIAVSFAPSGSGGFCTVSESASPTMAVSGVRTSCERAESIELRRRSDAISICAWLATWT